MPSYSAQGQAEHHLGARAVRHFLEVRKKIEVCTDPQMRCYYGVFAKSEMRWTPWEEVLGTHSGLTLEGLEDTMSTFKKINPEREYRIVEREASMYATINEETKK